MNSLQFPLSLTFKISTFSNDFVAQDANGNTVASDFQYSRNSGCDRFIV